MPSSITKAIVSILLLLACQCSFADDPLAPRANFLGAPDRIEWETGGLYNGRFDDGTPFQIQLAYKAPASVLPTPEEFRIAYWYPRHFTGVRLMLVQQESAAGTIRLAEPAWAHTDAETFEILLSPDRQRGSGTWVSPTRGKHLSFVLHRAILYKQIVVRRPPPPKELGETMEPRPFVFSAIFPVLDDGGAKAWMHRILSRCVDNTECLNSVIVDWRSPTLLSLDGASYGYSFEAPHGNTQTEMQHYRLDNGRMQPVGLAYFLDRSAACRARASAQIVAKLAAQNLTDPKAGALDERYDPRFLALPGGLEFHFDQYEVGSYAEGMPSVVVSRAELGPCVHNLPSAG